MDLLARTQVIHLRYQLITSTCAGLSFITVCRRSPDLHLRTNPENTCQRWNGHGFVASTENNDFHIKRLPAILSPCTFCIMPLCCPKDRIITELIIREYCFAFVAGRLADVEVRSLLCTDELPPASLGLNTRWLGLAIWNTCGIYRRLSTHESRSPVEADSGSRRDYGTFHGL
jgi:hypothetical protein